MLRHYPDGEDKNCGWRILAPFKSYYTTKTSELGTYDEVSDAESDDYHVHRH